MKAMQGEGLTILPSTVRRPNLLWPALFTFVAFVILVALGLWQLQRLGWKEAIIARIEARAKAPPAPLPAVSDWAQLSPDDYDYRHVDLVGTFEHDKEVLVFRGAATGAHVLGPGYHVLTPLKLASGAFVIVNRGFVPLERKDPSQRAAGNIEGEVHVTGLMRSPEPRNMFTPADDPANGLYFTRDPALIAVHFGLTEAAPFSVDADDSQVPGGWPNGGTTELVIPNNHLSYALTWFGLAAGLVGVFVAFALRKQSA
jgi:surfeit locus 1 family protein